MEKEFLGRGWKFPVQVEPSTGRIALSSSEEDIKEAIQIITFTNLGERVMRSDFGSTINHFIFDPLTQSTLSKMESKLKKAIMHWEPRVKEINVEVVEDIEEQNKIIVKISGVIRSTNNLFNLVYPYYINEGPKFK